MSDDLFARERMEQIRARISKACARARREASEVLLIGASKTVAVAMLHNFLDAGLKNCGENYVQEGVAKLDLVRGHDMHTHWHLIGALQSNKAREAVKYFDFIHSVDRPSLILALNKAARELNKIQDVLLQVNLGEEISKAGCSPQDASTLAAQIGRCENLKLCGLMCLPPFHQNPETRRPYFRALRILRDEIAQSVGGKNCKELSMGMSHDFEIAIEEGATMIRIGTALFGERKNAEQNKITKNKN
jgi:pyridoxal phosphate enzyme (YggS family)